MSSARAVRCFLTGRTSATLALSCHLWFLIIEHSKGTARVKWKEGGDDVKSAWPLYPGLHTCYNACYRGTPNRKVEQILKKQAQFGLRAAIRPHEAGIASNGASSRRREYVPGPCTHRPSSAESGGHLKSRFIEITVNFMIGAKS